MAEVEADVVYLVCGGHLVALDRDSGAERWRANVGMAVHPLPVVAGADAVVVLGPLKLSCVDASTGVLRWSAPFVLDPAAHLGLFDDAVIVGSRGEVRCFELSNGALRWQSGLKGLGFGPVTLACPGRAVAGR